MKRIILIFLSYAVFVNAQSYSLGFDLDASMVRVNYEDETHIISPSNPPISAHFRFGFNQNENLSWYARIGGAIFTEFTGWGVRGQRQI